MPDYTGNTFNDINPQYPEDTELAGYHAAAMRQVKRFLKQPEGLESIISEWLTSSESNIISEALKKYIRIPLVGEIYITTDSEFNPNDEDNQLYFSGTWEQIKGALLMGTGAISCYTPNSQSADLNSFFIDAGYNGTTPKQLTSGLEPTNPGYRWFHFESTDDPNWFSYNYCYNAILLNMGELSSVSLTYDIGIDELNVVGKENINVKITYANEAGYAVGTTIAEGVLSPRKTLTGSSSYSLTGNISLDLPTNKPTYLIVSYNTENPSQWLTNSKGYNSNIIASYMGLSVISEGTNSYEVITNATYQESVPFLGANIWKKVSDDNPNSDDIV